MSGWDWVAVILTIAGLGVTSMLLGQFIARRMVAIARDWADSKRPEKLPPYRYEVEGQLPAGMALDPATGRLYGTPESAGVHSFAMRVEDAPDSALINGARPASPRDSGLSYSEFEIVPVSVRLRTPDEFMARCAELGLEPLNTTVHERDPSAAGLDPICEREVAGPDFPVGTVIRADLRPRADGTSDLQLSTIPGEGLRVIHDHGPLACGAYLGTYTGPLESMADEGELLKPAHWRAWHGRTLDRPTHSELCPGCGTAIKPLGQCWLTGVHAIAQMAQSRDVTK